MTTLEVGCLLTERQLAEIVQVKVGTVRTWVKRGMIPENAIFKLPNSPKGTIRFIEYKIKQWLTGEDK